MTRGIFKIPVINVAHGPLRWSNTLASEVIKSLPKKKKKIIPKPKKVAQAAYKCLFFSHDGALPV